MSEYYLSCLERDRAKAYNKIYEGLCDFANNVSVPFGRRDSLELLRRVRLDHPEIFWVKGVSTSGSAAGTSVIPSYSFSRRNAALVARNIRDCADKIVLPASGLCAAEKVEFVHRFILENIVYTSAYRNFSHEIYGVLTNRIGVCEGIAKTVTFLLGLLDVECITVQCVPDSRNAAHAWNIISAGGKQLHYDMTFDLTSGRADCHRYYGLTDGEIFADHLPSELEIPRCV